MKKVISALITIILLVWVGLLAYDYYRSTKNEPPLIIIKEETHNCKGGQVLEYTSLGYKYIKYNCSSRVGFMFGGFWITVDEE